MTPDNKSDDPRKALEQLSKLATCQDSFVLHLVHGSSIIAVLNQRVAMEPYTFEIWNEDYKGHLHHSFEVQSAKTSRKTHSHERLVESGTAAVQGCTCCVGNENTV